MNNMISSNDDFRYERKFHPTHIDTKEMNLLILLHSYGFVKVHPDRTVNNIYLDTQDFAAYFENIEGLSPRIKHRIRWYGDAFTKTIRPTLEVKRKFGLVGDKIRVPMGSFYFGKDITQEGVSNLLADTRDESGLCLLSKGLNCTLFNQYERSYYASIDGLYRITVDRNLSYSPFRKMRADFSFVKSDPNIIVELKYATGYERGADEITREFALRIEKISKYVQGIKVFSEHFVLK